MSKDPVQIRPLENADRTAVTRFIEQEWGARVLVVHGTVFRPAELPGFLAQSAGGPLAGLLTYIVSGGVMEIVTLNAVQRLSGTGTALLERAAAQARWLGCREVMLTTTNDNLEGLRFYHRRGFRLTTLRPGAVTESRKVKPEIPQTGDHGIPLRDELDLVRPL
jgi:GNAT superfamily N-acetyltransferase